MPAPSGPIDVRPGQPDEQAAEREPEHARSQPGRDGRLDDTQGKREQHDREGEDVGRAGQAPTVEVAAVASGADDRDRPWQHEPERGHRRPGGDQPAGELPHPPRIEAGQGGPDGRRRRARGTGHAGAVEDRSRPADTGGQRDGCGGARREVGPGRRDPRRVRGPRHTIRARTGASPGLRPTAARRRARAVVAPVGSGSTSGGQGVGDDSRAGSSTTSGAGSMR